MNYTELKEKTDLLISKCSDGTYNNVSAEFSDYLTEVSSFLRLAKMEASARECVLLTSGWLLAEDESKDWEEENLIFYIDINGNNYYPEYLLHYTDGRPIDYNVYIIEELSKTKDGWGMAFWFASVNSFLGGDRPMDIVERQPVKVLRAAEEEIKGVTHG